MNSNVSAVVAQVAANVAAENASGVALVKLVAQVADLNAKLADAISHGFTPEDESALVKAVSDLDVSAKALVAVTPAA